MKRTRAPNFTTAEIMHLLNLIEKYPVLENKQTDSASSKEKQMAWKKLADEYNSQTNFCPRTADNLLSCYKNQKIKVKKMHSKEKMTITAPLLLNAIEEHGQDWDQVAQATDASSLDCQSTFGQLVQEAKKEEALHKKEMNRTGGGPPSKPSCSSNDLIFEKVKTLIGPSLEGLYTVYDGDAEFIKEQQALASSGTPLPAQPIELNQKSSPLEEIGCTQKRLKVLKRKVDPNLGSLKKGKTKLHVSQSFQELAQDKKDLVKAQKLLIDSQIEHQNMLIEMAAQKIHFENKKNEMELEYLQEKYKLELNILRNKKN